MPRTPKKTNPRKPSGRSSLSRVFAEAIDDGLAQARGDYADDLDDEADEEEIDDEAYEYTVEAQQQRGNREADKQRALKLQLLVDEINALNRSLTGLGATVVDTPAASEFADVTMIDEPGFEAASRRLAGEMEQIRQAVRQAQEQREERLAAAERGRQIRERIAVLRAEQQELVEVWEAKKVPDTPCADQFETCAGLTQEQFGDADGRLQGEEQAVRLAVEQRRSQDAVSQTRAVEAQRRAKALRKAVDDYDVLRRQLKDRAAELGLSMINKPLAFAEYKAPALGRVQFNTIKSKLDKATLGATLRLDLLNCGRANWSGQGMTKLDVPVQKAFASLLSAIDAKDDSNDYGALSADVSTWVEDLRKHAKQRMLDIPKEKLDEDIRDFYESYNQGQPVPKDVHKQEMEDFARQYEYPPENWATFKKLYNALKVQERQRNTVPVPVDGRLPKARLRRVLPSGITAGQWYTHDQSFDSGTGEEAYAYHLSVAFSVEPVRGEAVEMARLTGIHASFKRGKEDRKYWWNVNGATVTANGVSGDAVLNGTMHARAIGLLNSMKHRLNLL